MTVMEYVLPDNLEETGYCVFSADLEDDALVLFHGTPAENLESILENGFRIPSQDGGTGLSSVSFAKRSSMALGHACTKRESEPGDYVIIAVRYESLERKGLKVNVSDIHDYTLDPAPEVIGFCRVPTTYRHA